MNFGECTSLCDGQSCRSVDGKKGACVVLGATNCEDLGGVEVDGECILEGVKTTYECDMVFFLIIIFILICHLLVFLSLISLPLKRSQPQFP